MQEIENEELRQLANQLGLSADLSAILGNLLEHFQVAAMHPEEQTIFFLEVGRLVRDRYLQRVAALQGTGAEDLVPTFAECAQETINELIQDATV